MHKRYIGPIKHCFDPARYARPINLFSGDSLSSRQSIKKCSIKSIFETSNNLRKNNFLIAIKDFKSIVCKIAQPTCMLEGVQRELQKFFSQSLLLPIPNVVWFAQSL